MRWRALWPNHFASRVNSLARLTVQPEPSETTIVVDENDEFTP